MLTITEKKLVEGFLKKSEKMNIEKGHDLVSSILFATGGAIIVLACLATVNSLTAENMKLILFPGVATGMAILLAGAYGLHLSKNTREQKSLASAIKKLTS